MICCDRKLKTNSLQVGRYNKVGNMVFSLHRLLWHSNQMKVLFKTISIHQRKSWSTETMEKNLELCPNFEQLITLSLEIASTKIVCILGYGVGKSLKQWPFKALRVHELYQVNMYSFCKDFPQYSLMDIYIGKDFFYVEGSSIPYSNKVLRMVWSWTILLSC